MKTGLTDNFSLVDTKVELKMSVTPESDKTVSKTVAEGPTPKNEFKKPVHQR